MPDHLVALGVLAMAVGAAAYVTDEWWQALIAGGIACVLLGCLLALGERR